MKHPGGHTQHRQMNAARYSKLSISVDRLSVDLFALGPSLPLMITQEQVALWHTKRRCPCIFMRNKPAQPHYVSPSALHMPGYLALHISIRWPITCIFLLLRALPLHNPISSSPRYIFSSPRLSLWKVSAFFTLTSSATRLQGPSNSSLARDRSSAPVGTHR